MSTPPQEPTNPQDPAAGANGTPANQPQYGQTSQPSQPQYGQPAAGQDAGASYNYPGANEAAAPYTPGAYGNGAPAGPVATPKYVNIAFWLYLAAAALFIIGGIVNILAINSPTGRDLIRQSIETSNQTVPAGTSMEEVINIAVGAGTGFVIFMMIIVAICYPLWAVFFRKGKGWARIMATIFAAIAIFIGWVLAGAIFGTIAIILGIVAVILLYIGDSAPYFRKAPKY
ncbi:hypothetical protein [Haematomicrobium sanguinis]|uniref:hypothetical protein n=1 Tax=Haematomicrobium sanguinis TaxID=479106 RepID=UPI0004787BD9|nr:hypothetical protein [Haematomicrobium sanguinis]